MDSTTQHPPTIWPIIRNAIIALAFGLGMMLSILFALDAEAGTVTVRDEVGLLRSFEVGDIQTVYADFPFDTTLLISGSRTSGSTADFTKDELDAMT